MNTNFLSGMRCPECGSYGPYKIVCSTLLTVNDDGTECDTGDINFEASAYCRCCECENEREVNDFSLLTQENCRKKYRVILTQEAEDMYLDYNDVQEFGKNGKGIIVYVFETRQTSERRALNEFHATIPISCVEDYRWDVKRIADCNNDEFECMTCHGIFDNDDSIRIDGALFCEECSQN